MKADKLDSKAWDCCREIILKDEKLIKIDAEIYELLDGMNDEMAMNLEEAYLEYGARAIELAYLQGMKDAKQK